MELPKSIRKVKPNEIVVFDSYCTVNDLRVNAFAITDDGNLMFFDTETYYTSGKPKFYNLEEGEDNGE